MNVHQEHNQNVEDRGRYVESNGFTQAISLSNSILNSVSWKFKYSLLIVYTGKERGVFFLYGGSLMIS